MFEGIKIVGTLECVYGFILKCWTNIWQKKLTTLQKKLQFHLISWCPNFVERHSFRIVSGD